MMKRNPSVMLVFSLVLALSQPLAAENPPDAGQKLDELGTAMRGAAASTRRRVLEQFRNDLDGTIVSLTGSVWTLSSIDLSRSQDDGSDTGPALFSWEYQGLLVRDNSASSPSQSGRAIRRRLGGADKATLIIVRSGKYQLYALTASPTLVDQLRQGAPITIEAQITGLRENSLLGFVTTILEAVPEARCPRGHQLPKDNDFHFCPYCGSPLK